LSTDSPPRGLFEAARRGDAAAHEELSRLARAFARQICRGGGPSGVTDMDWEDVAQESLRKVLATGLERYRGTGGESSYMYSVVKTTVIQMSRTARRRQQREQKAASDAIVAPNPGHRVDVLELLGLLSEECRELIERAFLYGEPYPALARDLGLAESSVRSRLSRCLGRARAIAKARDVS
jgi:RNA polymerase sigma factor (sigma-70 family)